MQVTKSIFSAFYHKSLNIFRNQYGDVVFLTRLYVNKENKVYGGEWLDSKGTINFTGGFALDIEKEITFK